MPYDLELSKEDATFDEWFESFASYTDIEDIPGNVAHNSDDIENEKEWMRQFYNKGYTVYEAHEDFLEKMYEKNGTVPYPDE